MKQFLSETDRSLLDRRITDAEKKTGAQIVLTTVKRSDSYAEIPWKAFAVGVSVSGFGVLLYNLFVLSWMTVNHILLSLAIVLAAGFFFVVLTIIFPLFARLFLPLHRRETETMQYAESLFLSHELFATSARRGILVMVSVFEKQVVILPDKGIRDKLTPEIMEKIISAMANDLQNKRIREAFENGLDELVRGLATGDSVKSGSNELSNEIIEEEGE
jgi:putative membrane protein